MLRSGASVGLVDEKRAFQQRGTISIIIKFINQEFCKLTISSIHEKTLGCSWFKREIFAAIGSRRCDGQRAIIDRWCIERNALCLLSMVTRGSSRNYCTRYICRGCKHQEGKNGGVILIQT